MLIAGILTPVVPHLFREIIATSFFYITHTMYTTHTKKHPAQQARRKDQKDPAGQAGHV